MAALAHIWLPVLTTLSLARALSQAFPHARLHPAGAWTLALGVLAVYTADRLLERERLPNGWRGPLWTVTTIALLAVGVLSLRFPLRILPVDVLLGLASITYGVVKRRPFLKTLPVMATWWVGCTLLPYDLRGEPGLNLGVLVHPAALGLAVTVAAGAILCDFKDTEADARAGVPSLPVRVGTRGTQLICAGLAVTGGLLAASTRAWALLACALLMLMLVPMLGLLRRPLAGPLVVDGLLTLPGLWPWL